MRILAGAVPTSRLAVRPHDEDGLERRPLAGIARERETRAMVLRYARLGAARETQSMIRGVEQ